MIVETRFLVRMGSVGWMVYDRNRKGPALTKNNGLAEKLTKPQAEQLKQELNREPLSDT